jgi:microcystin-dependent protein
VAEPFLGEIRLMSFNFAPKGWAMCNAQLLPINQNQGLFSLLGTTYGGDGRVNFGLPDLRGRTSIHTSGGHALGERGGEQAHTLSISELPTHAHAVQGSGNTGNTQDAANNVLAVVPGRIYTDAAQLTNVNPATITNVGGSQAHANMQPFLALNFCIALQGIFPSQN